MEIYVKAGGDPNYVDTEVQVESEVEMLISQIEMVLFTRRGDVIGSPDLGCNLEDTLYTLGFNEHQLKSLIQQQVISYVPLAMKYNVKVDVVFERGEVADRAYIDILIDNKYMISVSG
jgi:hypothetical protein